MIEYIELDKLVKLENNPRKIYDKDFHKLMKSIQENGVWEGKPLLVSDRTGELVIIAGNQRYDACVKLGFEKVPCYIFKNITEAKEKEIAAKDNSHNGQWDYTKVLLEYEMKDLIEWGIEVPELGEVNKLDDINHSDENAEWVGMPEFAEKESDFKFIINFESEEAREEFVTTYELPITSKKGFTWSTNYPFTGRQDLASIKFE